MITAFRFGLLSLIWLVVGYSVSTLALNGSIWWSFVSTVLIGLPYFAAKSYEAAVERRLKLLQIEEGSGVYFLFSGSLFSNLYVAVVSALFGFLTIFWFLATTQLEHIALALSIPVYFVIHYSVKHHLAGTVKQLSLHSFSEVLSRIAFTLVMVSGYFSFLIWSEGGASDVIMGSEIGRVAIDYTDSRSVLVQLLHNFAVSYEYLRNTMIRQVISADGAWRAIILASLLLFWFYHLGTMLSAFTISFSEYRSVVKRKSTTDEKEADFRGGFTVALTLVIVYGFIALPTLTSTETYLRDNPDKLRIIADADSFAFRQVERIGNQLYEVGTIQSVEAANRQLNGDILALIDANQSVVEAKFREAFDRMRSNVDAYLDHYYSLPAEYVRLASAVSGQMEERITKDIQRFLNRGVEDLDFVEFATSHSAEVNQLIKAYESTVRVTLDDNKVSDDTPSTLVIVKDVSSEFFSTLASPSVDPAIPFSTRMATAGATSMAAFITAKITGKLAAKSIISTAAKAVAKFGGKKIVTTAGGLGLGAAIGSVVPGPGTAIGGLIGAGVGLLAGLAVDVGLLKLEESYNRAEFRAEIIKAINSAETELLTHLSE